MEEAKKSFSKIYGKYIDKIYRFIFLKVSSQAEAEDLTSETFLRLWQKLNQNTGQMVNGGVENVQAFLYKIARNLTIDYYRQKGKVQFVSTESVAIIDPRQKTEEDFAFKSDMESIKLAIADLKEDYQNVIIWYYLDDLPMPEIALLLDRTEEASRVLLHRALESLKQRLNQQA